MIPVPDWLLVAVQWVHHMGAIAWVGGSIFFRFVLQPAFRKAGIGRDSARTIGHEFGSIVRIAIVILIVTGAFMAVVHLGAGGNSRLYIGLLALKIALAFYMFLLVWLRRRSAPSENAGGPESFWPRFRRAITGTTALLILGVIVIGLADVLGAVHGADGHDHGSGGHSEVVESNGHGSDDHHHESGDSVDEDMGGLKSSEPDKDPQGGESDGHDHDHAEDGDEDEDGDGQDDGHAEDGDEDGDGDGHDDGHAEDDDGDGDGNGQDDDHMEDDDGDGDGDGHDHDHAEDDDEDGDGNGHDHDHAEDDDEDGDGNGHDHDHMEDDDGDEDGDGHDHDHAEDDDEDGGDDGHDHDH